ncbi:50S ribosomal protein L11 methyltransferase [uncultured Akkermansia sp.]|uniref:50S ribosomal protein L11 methyltransferase n=1 Tax=uncultured Akkermansia sp. TaxID=512294 RepID=UPI0025E189CD|nr:50S ribosomal protein L11 methyltransferase [uncultured Akkermansia sp.]
MTWSWNKLSPAKWEDAWSERIAGNPNASITIIKGGKTIRITVYCDREEDALTLKQYFGGTVREIKTRDWVAAQNREERAPLRIRNSLVITEQSSAEKLAALQQQFPGRRILSVPAEMAFGTGDHATTSTCLRFIADFAQSRKETAWIMTDIGCGTAVLAIAALKLGAEHATAFDFDPMAVEVARHNMERNAVTAEQLDLFVGDVFEWTPAARQKGNLVVANLFSTILQKAFPHIIAAMKKDAVLVISGILASQWEETKAAAERNGLSFDRVIKRGKWVTAKGGMAK